MLAVRMLGPLQVDGAHRLGPRDFGGIKPRQLLEILLAARGRAVPKERLAELLWGDAQPRDAFATLETYVSGLRRRLGQTAASSDGLVVTETGAYRFAVDRVDLDLDRFDDLLARAEAATGAARRRLLETALGLVRADLLEDEPYATWLEDLRAEYRERVAQARLDAADAAFADADFGAGLAHAQRVLAGDPLDERAHRLVMLSLYASGRRHAALQAFDRCRAVLRDELGVDPLPETHALHTAILREEPVGPDRGRPGRPVPASPAEAAAGIAVVVLEQTPGMDAAQLVNQLAERFPARPARVELAGAAVDRTLQAVTTAVRDWAPTVLLIDVLPEPAEI
jgi:DNA-binding SARP family transcriptional activator